MTTTIETMHVFVAPVTKGEAEYRAEVRGRPRTANLWEAWIEFFPLPDGEPIRSPRETTQPTREALEYWSEGLSPVYLAGALERALRGGSSANTDGRIGTALDEPSPIQSSPVEPPSDEPSPDESSPVDAAVERVYGHGVIRHGGKDVGEADYDLIVTPPELRGTGLTFEAGQPGGEPQNLPDITGRLLGPLFQAEAYADDVHTLVLEDGRAFDFRVVQPDTNEIVGVSSFTRSS